MITLETHPSLGLARGTTVLRDYDDRWPEEFALEAARLRSILCASGAAIEHIGSTAVPGLAAKPVIDIAIALGDASAMTEARGRLRESGYEGGEDMGDEGGIVFARGPETRRTHFLHLVGAGSDQWLRYLAFRDALRADAGRRDAYAALKRDLAARYPRDRPSYVSGKAQFILSTIETHRGPRA
jgi:GrpB-like predicted nucleotidyltransferase (UPF0157 family)